MSSPSSQPSAYNRFDPLFDPLNEANSEAHLPSLSKVQNAPKSDVKRQAASGAASGAASEAASDGNGTVTRETMTQTEERRARHLLDRAFALWEKGDNNGAILACRQSMAIDSKAAGAYSMLGLLLERAGDVNGAIAAYDKAVALEPSSVLERDSAQRLRAANRHAAAPMFHFEDAELFAAPTDNSPDAIPDAPFEAIPAEAIPAEAHQATETAKLAPAPSAVAAKKTPASNASPNAAPNGNATAKAATAQNAAINDAGDENVASSTRTRVSQAATTNSSLTSAAAATMAAGSATAASNRTTNAAVRAVQNPNAGTQPLETKPPGTQPQSDNLNGAVRNSTVSSPGEGVVAPFVTASVTASAALLPQQVPATSASRNTNSSTTIFPMTATPSVSASSVAAPISAPSVSATRLDLDEASSNWWMLWQNARTFWMRSLPLMAIGGTGFLFLLWCRGVALRHERSLAPSSSVTVVNDVAATSSGVSTVVIPAQNGVANVANNGTSNGTLNIDNSSTGMATANSAMPNGIGANGAKTPTPAPLNVVTPVVPAVAAPGLIVNNAPAKPAASNASRNGRSAASDSSRESDNSQRSARREGRERRIRRSDGGEESSSSRFVSPNIPAPSVRSIPPANVTDLPRSPSGSSTSPSSNGSALPPIISVPSNDGGNGNGGNGSSGNGSGGNANDGSNGNAGNGSDAGTLPQFPPPAQVQSRSQEQIRPTPLPSNDASRAEDAAYKYQMRALIYVEQGNNARAASDFQSAIALYQRQLTRGQNVEEARRGLQACRQALSLITTS